MAVYYFDASALAKAYLIETGTSWVRSVLDPAALNDIHILNLTEVEVASAITRRSRAGAISPPLTAALVVQLQNDASAEFHVMDVSPDLVQRAISLVGQYALRAYDAVQLTVEAGLLALRQDGELRVELQTVVRHRVVVRLDDRLALEVRYRHDRHPLEKS